MHACFAGSATVTAYDSATVTAYGSATVTSWYGSHVVSLDGAAIHIDRRQSKITISAKVGKAGFVEV